MKAGNKHTDNLRNCPILEPYVIVSLHLNSPSSHVPFVKSLKLQVAMPGPGSSALGKTHVSIGQLHALNNIKL
ncbi:hypothetical protein JHK82_014673 [Glycine max]|uniref:Uncharacterized protein n=1 Tax=Glycine max TaxID=3847 RepID=K7KTS2_SOYBN|nr:hypothetical protein JHK82_014673 [Glycine max]KAH1124713.1 hypothetical protein GYH30_014413 [Glycine max]